MRVFLAPFGLTPFPCVAPRLAPRAGLKIPAFMGAIAPATSAGERVGDVVIFFSLFSPSSRGACDVLDGPVFVAGRAWCGVRFGKRILVKNCRW